MSHKLFPTPKKTPGLTQIGVRIACFTLLQWGIISNAPGQSHSAEKQDIHSARSTITESTSPSLDLDLGALRKNVQKYPVLVIETEETRKAAQTLEERPVPLPVAQDVLAEELEAARQINEIGSRIRKLMELQRNSPVPTTHQSDAPPVTPAVNLSEPDGVNYENDDATKITPTLSHIQTTRILDTPPDKIALADSLFYTGELDLALNIYQRSLQVVPDSREDHVWIRFQIASCYRRMQKFDDAKKILRTIAEGSDKDPIVINARWWLDTIERKRKLLDSIAILDQFIQKKSDELNDE